MLRNVHIDFVSTGDGKAPVIVQHKFESRNNIGRFYLDFKSLTLKQANEVIDKIDFVPKVFFYDRVSPAILKLASVVSGNFASAEIGSFSFGRNRQN